jgi:coenzyme Q-binding protein COQ10
VKHIERHQSAYTPAQLFDLVADVERYPDFLRWVIAAKVQRREDRVMWTHLTMGTSLFHRRFVTVAYLDRPHRIDVNSRDPMFDCFDQVWTFKAAAQGGTAIEYRVDLILKSRVLRTFINGLFIDGAKTMVEEYMRRAQVLYGPPRMPLRNEQLSTLIGKR